MIQIKWTVEAAKNYKLIYDKNENLRVLIDQRLDALADWPPKKWFYLRDMDGIIRFKTENDQFVVLSGKYEEAEKVVWICRFELQTKRRR